MWWHVLYGRVPSDTRIPASVINNATGFPGLDVSLSYTFGPVYILCTLGYAKDLRRGFQNSRKRSAVLASACDAAYGEGRRTWRTLSGDS